jgi:hypothetical protein
MMAWDEDKHPRDSSGRFTSKGNAVAMGAAVAIVVSGLISGGVGGATSVSAVDEFSISTRSPRGQAEVRIKGDDDAVKATTRLRLRGGHPIKLDARADKNCAYSNGDLQVFFNNNHCTSLYRTLIEYKEGNYVIRFLIATIEVPDYNTAIDLNALLSREGGGNIAALRSAYARTATCGIRHSRPTRMPPSSPRANSCTRLGDNPSVSAASVVVQDCATASPGGVALSRRS